MSILVIAEYDNASLKAATLHTVTAAAVIATFTDVDVHVQVAGRDVHAVAEQASKIAGVSKVLLLDPPQVEADLAENIEATVLNIAKDYSHILAPATAHGKNIEQRIAAKLDVGQTAISPV